MKVLQINSVCGYGSTGRIAVDLYHTLKQNGHDSMIAYGRGSTPEDVNAIRIGSDLNVMVHGVMSRLTDKHGFYSKRATKELICKIKDYDPDIIHLHNLHGYYLNIEELFHYLAESNKPVIWTLHDCWSFTGHCSHFDFIGCDNWKMLCHNCPQRKEYPASLLFDNSKWNYNRKSELFNALNKLTIVTPSEWLASMVKQSFLSTHQVNVIYNGIDLNIFKPTLGNFRKKYYLQDKFVILGVANVWNSRKGLSYLLDISEKLGNEYKVVILGVSEKQKRNLPSNVVGITQTNDIHQLAEIYTAADLFVNPTLEETLGLVNIESLACGTPVVTFNSGGSPESLDSNCGFVVEKSNLDQLLNAVARCKAGNFLNSNCIERAKAFDKSIMLSKYLSLYQQILTG